MKRVICILMACVLCFGLCACQDKNPEKKPTEPTQEQEMLAVAGTIKETYNDYFIMRHYEGTDGEESLIKVQCKNAKEYCKGAWVTVKYTDKTTGENDEMDVVIAISVEEHIVEVAKPIIYLYPEVETECTVTLDFAGKLTCTYPAYKDEWRFTAKPDSTLVFPDGKEYYALYWEGTSTALWDLTKGFCVKGEDTAEFLEWALAAQGLTAREANEFIVYWLPLMQGNAYNVISFQTDVYEDAAKLNITPAPDSMLRVFMTYYAADEFVELEAQEFKPFERTGFTVVEWGGSKAK